MIVPAAGFGFPAAGVAEVFIYTLLIYGPLRERIPKPFPLVESTMKLQSIRTGAVCPEYTREEGKLRFAMELTSFLSQP